MSKNLPVLAGINCFKFRSGNNVFFPGNKETMEFKDGKTIAHELASSNGKAFMCFPDASAPGKIKRIGVLGTMKISAYQPDGGIEVEFTAESRARVLDANIDPLKVNVKPLTQRWEVTPELTALAQEALKSFVKILENSSVDSAESANTIAVLQKAAEDPLTFPDMLATCLKRQSAMDQSHQLELIQTLDPKERLDLMYKDLLATLTKEGTKERLIQTQREYFLREQIKTAKQELGQDDEDENELDELEKKIAEADMPEEARKKCEKELKKLRKMNTQDANYSKTLEYLEEVLGIPWNKYSETEKSLQSVREILDADHYGLDKPKERVVQDVAVQLRTGKPSGTILCLEGPPGVGKTSIGESVARATGRKFVRVSLGGISDEADIRGHRTTYVGAMAGRIAKAIQEAGTLNPVIMLDEIDKMGGGSGFKGDPSAALLEVLDPAQNHSFKDHYLGVDLDLSNVLFIATANDPSKIPEPLLDRMEHIPLEGYPDDEKMEIATRYLIKRQMEKCGLTEAEFSITNEALAELIDGYTREAGVRSLEQQIGNLALATAVKLEEGKAESVTITPENLEEYAGTDRVEREMAETEPRDGLVSRVNGLYVSGAGGGMLPLEGGKYPSSSGGFVVTGKLQDIMKESAVDAYDYVRIHAQELGIPQNMFTDYTVRIKAGDGATPKDGPSAGLAMATLITSVLTGIPVRPDVAMTGEIGLPGKSMSIGGVKFKLLGALKAGIKTVLIPKSNEKDLAIVNDSVKQNLEIIPVADEMEVLKHALVEPLKPLAAAADEKPADENIAGQFNDAAALKEAVAEAVASMFQTAFQATGKPAANDDATLQIPAFQRPAVTNRTPAGAP